MEVECVGDRAGVLGCDDGCCAVEELAAGAVGADVGGAFGADACDVLAGEA